MRLSTILFTFISAAALSLTACGGGGDNGDDTADIDASTGDPIDAAESPDAPGGNDVTGLGQVCNQQMACPTEASLCADLDQPADNAGFCTLSCGTGPENTAEPNNPEPPAGGDAICAGAYSGATGAPTCALFTAAQAGQHTWYCAVLCPNGQNDCPSGLTCSAGLCDD